MTKKERRLISAMITTIPIMLFGMQTNNVLLFGAGALIIGISAIALNWSEG